MNHNFLDQLLLLAVEEKIRLINYSCRLIKINSLQSAPSVMSMINYSSAVKSVIFPQGIQLRHTGINRDAFKILQGLVIFDIYLGNNR